MSCVVLTQVAPRIEQIARRLESSGHRVVRLPSARLIPDADACEQLPARIVSADWVIFVSPGAIDIAFGALNGCWPDVSGGPPDYGSALPSTPSPRWPVRTGIALIGPGSRDALAQWLDPGTHARVMQPDCPPYDADALLRMPPLSTPDGLRVLVVRGEGGALAWIGRLRDAGARVDALDLYRSLPAPDDGSWRPAVEAWRRTGAAVFFVFTTQAAVRATEQRLSEISALEWARDQIAVAQHPRIDALLRALGWRRRRLVEPGEAGLHAGIESPS